MAAWDPFADLAVPARPRRERAQSVAEASRLRQRAGDDGTVRLWDPASGQPTAG